MPFIDVGSILEELFADELGRFGRLRRVEFIHHDHTDVYRVRAERASLIAHASPDGRGYLERVRANLAFLEPLEEARIPRVLGWRAGHGNRPGSDWAVLVYQEMPGVPLSRKNFDSTTWAGILECLARVHSLAADRQTPVAPLHDARTVAGFASLAQMLRIRTADLPLGAGRVSAHLDELGQFLDTHRLAFDVPPRVIHGDLDRKNIVAGGGRIAILDWAELHSGDYAFDLAMLKFMLDSVAPRRSAELVRDQARRYRSRFDDGSLELRLRFFLALAGLVHAFQACDDTGAFRPARAWRVRTSYLHSEAQWRAPMKLDGRAPGAPAARTEQWALDIEQPLRGLFYLLAPKKVA